MTVLLAGIGNLLLGDDGFGCAVAARLASMALPDGVRVVDFGSRGFDLALALAGDIDAAVLIDAMPRGGAPGTLYVLEPETAPSPERAFTGGHGLDPAAAIALAAQLAGRAPVVRVIGCEPGSAGDMALSPPVRAAVEPAADLALSVAESLRGCALGVAASRPSAGDTASPRGSEP